MKHRDDFSLASIESYITTGIRYVVSEATKQELLVMADDLEVAGDPIYDQIRSFLKLPHVLVHPMLQSAGRVAVIVNPCDWLSSNSLSYIEFAALLRRGKVALGNDSVEMTPAFPATIKAAGHHPASDPNRE